MKTEELRKIIDSALLTSGIDSAVKDQISKALSFEINSKTSVEFLKERLAVRFEYEKHYLELIKTFKEEIKGFCELNYGVNFPLFAKVNVSMPLHAEVVDSTGAK